MNKENKGWEEQLNKQFFGGIPTKEMGSNQVNELELQSFIRSLLTQQREEMVTIVGRIIDIINEDGRLLILQVTKDIILQSLKEAAKRVVETDKQEYDPLQEPFFRRKKV